MFVTWLLKPIDLTGWEYFYLALVVILRLPETKFGLSLESSSLQ